MSQRLKKAFLIGFIILFIASIIFWLIDMIVAVADKIWLPFLQLLGLQEYYVRSGIGSLALVAILAVFIGLILTTKFLERKVFERIPIMGRIWKWAKGISSKVNKLKGLIPVYFEYLQPGFEWIGFMSGIQEIEIKEKSGIIRKIKRVKIFVPNPPMPVTGQGFFISPLKIIGRITNNFDEILTMIFSATAISPDCLTIEEMPELAEENFEIEVIPVKS